jgi:hypothetical protein
MTADRIIAAIVAARSDEKRRAEAEERLTELIAERGETP